MFRHPDSGHNHDIRIANESFENVEKCIYLGTTLTNQNDIRDKLKSRYSSWNRLRKVKVKLSLCFLTKHHAMKAYWGIGGIAPLIL
jgi:hypothetical protein